MATYINIVQIIISAALITVIMLQAKGAGGLGGIFGGGGSFFRTRRGVEKTLFNFTIVLAALFVLTSILSLLPFALPGS
ncbi:MAG: preprotein translocase subunit SecG [Chloroflexi bacterium]|nr:preprotein translocase subunit SecG [Chloroflexota bacterium]